MAGKFPFPPKKGDKAMPKKGMCPDCGKPMAKCGCGKKPKK